MCQVWYTCKKRSVSIHIPKGSRVYLGAPAKPLDESLVRRISALVANVPSVLEAHLPQCFVEDVMPRAAQILVLVVSAEDEAPELVNAVGLGLGQILPPGEHLDIWPLSIHNSLIGSVRGARCQIYGQQGEPVQRFAARADPFAGLKRILQRFGLFSK